MKPTTEDFVNEALTQLESSGVSKEFIKAVTQEPMNNALKQRVEQIRKDEQAAIEAPQGEISDQELRLIIHRRIKQMTRTQLEQELYVSQLEFFDLQPEVDQGDI
tara:strand:- start:2887 stop:3201 length:315 start_codon:yes stop_codon:yes gene_type:complete